MKSSKVFLNDKFLNLSEAKISPLDRGFIFADGVYELIPFFHHQAFLLDKHLLRINKNLSEMQIEKCYDQEKEVYGMSQENKDLNASEFLLVTMKYLTDLDKARKHVKALEGSLKTNDHLIYRYLTKDDFGDRD